MNKHRKMTKNRETLMQVGQCFSQNIQVFSNLRIFAQKTSTKFLQNTGMEKKKYFYWTPKPGIKYSH